MFRQQVTRFSPSLYFSHKRAIFSNFREIFVRSKTVDPKEETSDPEDTNPKSLKTPEENKPVTQNFTLKTSEYPQILPFSARDAPRREESTKGHLIPPFSELTQGDIQAYTNYSIYNQLYSPYKWTPLVQKIPPSIEFQEKLYQLSKVRAWEESHTKELIDAFLFESLKGTDFDYYYDYKCEPSRGCKFHGIADFLIYKKSGNHFPIVPVLIARKKKNPLVKIKLEEFNVCEAVGAAAWVSANLQIADSKADKVRVLQTTGHTWVMYEFSKDGQFKKTGVYRPNTPGTYKKIYNDLEMQSVMLGLVRYASFIHTEGEIGLKKAYDFIDEAKYLEELDEETKSKFEKRQKFWRFLPKGLQNFFFNYK